MSEMAVMKHRNYILAGLGLCILTLLFSAFRSPDFARFHLRPSIPLTLMVFVVASNAYAAIYWTEPRSTDDWMVLHYGVKWGLAIGCEWAIAATVSLIGRILPGVFVIVNSIAPKDPPGAPIWAAATLCGLLLPFVAGAAGAIKARRVRFGTRVGFWSGVVSGLIGFHVVMAIGF